MSNFTRVIRKYSLNEQCYEITKAAGLHVVDDVLTTEAVMISSKVTSHPEIVELIKTRILGYMTATTYVP